MLRVAKTQGRAAAGSRAVWRGAGIRHRGRAEEGIGRGGRGGGQISKGVGVRGELSAPSPSPIEGGLVRAASAGQTVLNVFCR